LVVAGRDTSVQINYRQCTHIQTQTQGKLRYAGVPNFLFQDSLVTRLPTHVLVFLCRCRASAQMSDRLLQTFKHFHIEDKIFNDSSCRLRRIHESESRGRGLRQARDSGSSRDWL